MSSPGRTDDGPGVVFAARCPTLDVLHHGDNELLIGRFASGYREHAGSAIGVAIAPFVLTLINPAVKSGPWMVARIGAKLSGLGFMSKQYSPVLTLSILMSTVPPFLITVPSAPIKAKPPAEPGLPCGPVAPRGPVVLQASVLSRFAQCAARNSPPPFLCTQAVMDPVPREAAKLAPLAATTSATMPSTVAGVALSLTFRRMIVLGVSDV